MKPTNLLLLTAGITIGKASNHNSLNEKCEAQLVTVSSYKEKEIEDGHPVEETQGPLNPVNINVYGLIISGRWIPFPGTIILPSQK